MKYSTTSYSCYKESSEELSSSSSPKVKRPKGSFSSSTIVIVPIVTPITAFRFALSSLRSSDDIDRDNCGYGNGDMGCDVDGNIGKDFDGDINGDIEGKI